MPRKKDAGGLTPEEEMYVPPAVKRQLEAAEALASAQGGQEDPAYEDHPSTPEDAPIESPSIQSDDDQPPGDEPRKREDWKHKYQVLKGKYDAEIPELNSRLMALSATLDGQSALIQDLQQRFVEPPAEVKTPEVTPAAKVDLLDEAEFDGYGENIVKMVRQLNALIKSSSQPSAPTVDQGFKQRIERIEERVIRSAEQEYYEALDRSVSDWRALNRDPKFLKWLSQPDPITEIVRMQAIQRGAQAFNSRQVINIFNAYKKEAGLVEKPKPAKKDISGQVSIVPTTVGAEGDAELEARESGKYATRDEFQNAKNLYIKGRLSEADFNKVANRFQAAIRDKKVK